MCLFPTLIQNPKYKPNKKNGGVPPVLYDRRAALVPIGCKQCMECRKQKAREWSVRLQEDIKEFKNGKFITFTFTDEELRKLDVDVRDNIKGYERDNAIATLAVRRFLDRWRKEKFSKGKSLRHWLVTELGQTNTERIHIHGIIYTDIPKATVEKIWSYGNMGWKKTWAEERNYLNNRSINYLVKYMSKTDAKHPNYTSTILTSSGIGRHYTKSNYSKQNVFQKENTREHYQTESGQKLALPIYYRNKLYTELERECLWMHKLDQNTRWVNGTKIDISKTYDEYFQAVKHAREVNKKLGYGSSARDYDQKKYENQLRDLASMKRRSSPAQGGREEAPLGGGETDSVGVNSRIPPGGRFAYP